MSDFLSKIIEHKRHEILAAAKLKPERVLRKEASEPRDGRAFIERLAVPGPYGINVIAEIKRASPSKGKIRENIDPAEYGRKYEQGGAAAISVLTDAKFFVGGPDDLDKVRKAVSLPVLRKDFIISAYQVYESAVMGADALLLIVRALSPGLLSDLIAICADVGLDALVEIHDEKEYEIAVNTGAQIVGINNRDLTTFETDISNSIRIVGRTAPGPVLVAESGIHSRADVERLVGAGIRNFLIGQSIMSADDPVTFLKALHGVRS
jgi:indole-3-glycerol phosphate synthase